MALFPAKLAPRLSDRMSRCERRGMMDQRAAMHPPSLFTPLLFCTSNGCCAAERKTQGKLDADAHVRPSRVDGDERDDERKAREEEEERRMSESRCLQRLVRRETACEGASAAERQEQQPACLLVPLPSWQSHSLSTQGHEEKKVSQDLGANCRSFVLLLRNKAHPLIPASVLCRRLG